MAVQPDSFVQSAKASRKPLFFVRYIQLFLTFLQKFQLMIPDFPFRKSLFSSMGRTFHEFSNAFPNFFFSKRGFTCSFSRVRF